MSKIEELQQKRSIIEQGGGVDKIKKQHEAGKKTARERLAMLFDEGSFVEIDAFVKHRSNEFDMPETEAPGEGVVVGYGSVNGRLIYAYAQDFTVIGGSLGEMHAAKICKVMDMAMKMGAPIVGISDSGGARIQEGVDALSGLGDILYRNAITSGVVPQISIVLGPCAGCAVYSPAMSDFVFMVDKTSQMFTAGPQVIKGATGEDVSFEELGGAETHASKSGVCAVRCKDEEECFAKVKELFDYLPANNLEMAPVYESADEINRLSETLSNVVPDEMGKAYDMKTVIGEVVDGSSFYEIFSQFAENIIVGFARMNGMAVGIVANQPKTDDGALSIDAADKAARFIRFCDSFNIPLVSFTDVPGFKIGTEQEYNGIIRHGAKILYAFSEATVPKVNVIVRKAYGGAYIAMNSKHIGADMVFAWPSAQIAVMAPDGAANILFRKDVASSDDPINERQNKIEEYAERNANPYVAAARGYVDDVIEPDSTRPRIISALEMLFSKRETRPAKKHGNIPL